MISRAISACFPRHVDRPSLAGSLPIICYLSLLLTKNHVFYFLALIFPLFVFRDRLQVFPFSMQAPYVFSRILSLTVAIIRCSARLSLSWVYEVIHDMLLYFRRYPLYVFIAVQIVLFLFYYTSKNSSCFFSALTPKADYEWISSQVGCQLLTPVNELDFLQLLFCYTRNTFSARMEDDSTHTTIICHSSSSAACLAVVRALFQTLFQWAVQTN